MPLLPYNRHPGAARIVPFHPVLHAGLWTTYAVIRFAASVPAVQPGEYSELAVMQAVRAASAAACAAAMTALIDRVVGAPPSWQDALRLVLLVGGGAASWMILDRIALLMVASIGGMAVPWSASPRGLDLEYLFVMAAWAGGMMAWRSIAHSRALEEALLRERLVAEESRHRALVAQLNPHFLFNTLNMLRARMREDVEAASSLLSQLASLLRRVLALDPTRLVPLVEEVSLAQEYLSLQQARYETGLIVTIEVEPASGHTLVPAMILQPLLENCFVHGRPDENGVRRVWVRSDRIGDMTEIVVGCSGRLDVRPVSGDDSAGGNGLRITRDRLEVAYGGSATLALSGAAGSVVCRMQVPAPGTVTSGARAT